MSGIKSVFLLVLIACVGLMSAQHSKTLAADSLYDDCEDPPIITATVEGDAAAVRALIASGANVDTADEMGKTALLHAAIYEYYDVLVVLVEAGADLEATCREGYTPLTYAADRGFARGVQYPAEKGAAIEHHTLKGYTPFHSAVCGGFHLEYGENRHDDVLIELIKRGANVHTEASGRMTPLMVAVIHKRADLVRLLVSAGVDRSIINYKGETALTIARQKQYDKIVAILTSSAAR